MSKKYTIRPIEDIMEDILRELKIQNSQPIYPVITPNTNMMQCSVCRTMIYPYQLHNCRGFTIS